MGTNGNRPPQCIEAKAAKLEPQADARTCQALGCTGMLLMETAGSKVMLSPCMPTGVEASAASR